MGVNRYRIGDFPRPHRGRAADRLDWSRLIEERHHADHRVPLASDQPAPDAVASVSEAAHVPFAAISEVPRLAQPQRSGAHVHLSALVTLPIRVGLGLLFAVGGRLDERISAELAYHAECWSDR